MYVVRDTSKISSVTAHVVEEASCFLVTICLFLWLNGFKHFFVQLSPKSPNSLSDCDSQSKIVIQYNG